MYCKTHGHLSPDQCPQCFEENHCPHCKEPYQYKLEKHRRQHREKRCLANPNSNASRNERDRQRYARQYEERQERRAEFVNLIEKLIDAKLMMGECTIPHDQRSRDLESAKEDLFCWIDYNMEIKDGN